MLHLQDLPSLVLLEIGRTPTQELEALLLFALPLLFTLAKFDAETSQKLP